LCFPSNGTMPPACDDPPSHDVDTLPEGAEVTFLLVDRHFTTGGHLRVATRDLVVNVDDPVSSLWAQGISQRRLMFVSDARMRWYEPLEERTFREIGAGGGRFEVVPPFRIGTPATYGKWLPLQPVGMLAPPDEEPELEEPVRQVDQASSNSEELRIPDLYSQDTIYVQEATTCPLCWMPLPTSKFAQHLVQECHAAGVPEESPTYQRGRGHSVASLLHRPLLQPPGPLARRRPASQPNLMAPRPPTPVRRRPPTQSGAGTGIRRLAQDAATSALSREVRFVPCYSRTLNAEEREALRVVRQRARQEHLDPDSDVVLGKLKHWHRPMTRKERQRVLSRIV